jgi:hypothetical protein
LTESTDPAGSAPSSRADKEVSRDRAVKVTFGSDAELDSVSFPTRADAVAD